MLPIFVRPHNLGLDPGIQHAPLPDPVHGEWRRVFGPDGSDAPVTVRNAVDLYPHRTALLRTSRLPSLVVAESDDSLAVGSRLITRDPARRRLTRRALRQ